MKQKIYQAVVTALMFCLATVAQAAPPSISGPDTVCVGSYGNYSVVPQPYLSYQWSVTPGGAGVITTPVSPYPNATILWGITGAATITVTVTVDSTGLPYGSPLMLNVYVAPTPAPLITANVVVGCQTLDDSIIQITHTQHIINDSNGCVKVCQGSVVTYTAIGSATDTFGWNIVGGTILAQGADTCMVLWGAPGAGSVTVYDTSVWGCTGSKSVCIDIIARPAAHFYAIGDTSSDTVTICMNGSVMFVDNSTASTGSPIVSWFWSFGDGTYSEAGGTAPISHEYTTPGTDTATLVVKNACGCTDTFSMIVVVNPQTGVTIVCPGVVCQNASATYSLNPTPPCPISQFDSLWTVQGGTILVDNDSNITVQWNNVDTTGFGYVIFNSAPCTLPCPGVTVVKVPVIQTIGHISGPSVDCDNSQYLYNMPQWPTTVFNWSVSGTGAYLQHDDQNNQIVLNTSGPGTVYLTCKYTNTLLGCGGMAYDTITVLPSDSLQGPAEACLNTTAGSYQVGPGSGLNTNWTLYNPSGSMIDTHTGLTYTTPVLTVVGTYTLTVTPGTGALYCPIAPFMIKVVGLPPAPDSLLGPDTTCFGSPATYTAQNPIPGDIFEWAAVTGTCNAAEGNSSAITFTGSSPATVEVWRVTTDALHCHSDTISMQVYRPAVNLNITGMDTVCPSTVYHYDAGYSQGETYNWTVYNPLLGSVQTNGLDTADILFNNTSGPVDVIVEVRKCDTNYFDTLHAYIRPLPTLSISGLPGSVCDHVPISPSLSPGTITGGIEWYWGDGDSTCCTTTPTYPYNTLITTNTTYTILVVVTNPYGCPGTVSTHTTITVLPAPVAYISPAGPYTFCGSFSQSLTATLTGGFEATDSIAWMSVGTGFITGCPGSPPPCTSHTFTVVGEYYVIAIGANNCADTSNIVTIDTSCGGGGGGGGSCSLTPAGYVYIDTALISCGAVHLHGTYSGSPLTAFSWVWTPPAGASGVTYTNTTLDCSFGTAGLYTFGYTVGLTDGPDTCYITNDTTILVPFIAGIVYSATCGTGGYNVTLMDHSNYYPGYAPTRYSWYLNGVYQTYTTPPTSTYTMLLSPGAYSLGEWVYYSPTDSCWASDSLYLPALPVAGFTFARDTTCAQQASVQFTNTSTPGSGLSYLWDFGDVSGNTEENPYKVYGIGGPYFATLTVTNQYGCTSSVTHQVPIKSPPDLGGSLLGGGTFCAGVPVQLTYLKNVGTKYPDEYYWMQATDTMYATAYPVDYTYVYSSGSYWVSGTDTFGCYVNTSAVTVNIIQVPPAVITGSHYACYNVPYTLNGWVGDDPNVSYKWYKNGVLDGTGSSVTDPATYISSVPDTFMLVVFINYGGDTCSDTSAKFWVQVYPPPSTPSISASIISCATYTFSLSATPALAGSYNWSDGLSGQTITVTGGGPYGVWYTDTFGCTSFGSTYIDQDPTQYLWIFPTGCYTWCSTQTPTPYIVGPIIPFVFWKYQYAPVGPGVDSGYSYVTPWYPPGSGDYDLILENQYCSDTSGTMDITIDSNCSGCQCLKETISSYSVRCENPPGCCQYYISMCFDNSCYTIKASVSTASGTLTPNSLNIPLGYTCDTLLFTPGGSFTGGWVYINTVWSDGTMRYNCEDSVYIPLCNPGDRQSGSQQPAGIAMLDLVPNPAQNSTRIDYMLDGKQTTGSIEVYDMMGRLVTSYAVTTNAGSWQLSLDNYAAGVYMVMLKEGDITVKEGKLSVLR